MDSGQPKATERDEQLRRRPSVPRSPGCSVLWFASLNLSFRTWRRPIDRLSSWGRRVYLDERLGLPGRVVRQPSGNNRLAKL